MWVGCCGFALGVEALTDDSRNARTTLDMMTLRLQFSRMCFIPFQLTFVFAWTYYSRIPDSVPIMCSHRTIDSMACHR